MSAAWQSEMNPPVGLKYTQILFMYIYMKKMKNNNFVNFDSDKWNFFFVLKHAAFPNSVYL